MSVWGDERQFHVDFMFIYFFGMWRVRQKEEMRIEKLNYPGNCLSLKLKSFPKTIKKKFYQELLINIYNSCGRCLT